MMSAETTVRKETTTVRSRPSLARILLLLAIATTGLSAGFMYLWNEVMVPGFATLDDVTYIQAMNGVNSVIRNAPFAVAFFGSFVAIVATLAVSRRFARNTTLMLVGLAGALYLFVLVETFTIHVPMNRDLLQLTDLTGLDTASIRTAYETRWNLWHVPRAFATLFSFLSLVAAAGSEFALFGKRRYCPSRRVCRIEPAVSDAQKEGCRDTRTAMV